LKLAGDTLRNNISGKSVVILGSTGSIGCRALDVMRSLGSDWKVVGLTAGSNWQKLADQAKEFLPEAVAIADDRCYAQLKQALKNTCVNVLAGLDGVEAVAAMPEADITLCAIVGSASIRPAFAAVRSGKVLALASKEALVVTGDLLLAEVCKANTVIIPVDSEHSAVFQTLRAGRAEDVVGITLTASGGPFLHWPAEKIRNATLEQALNHPTWAMGPKITIDSSTMMNKALEIIEAHHLFDLPADQIRVVIHPESIVHSLAEFCDGVMIAQLSEPDMAVPIQYALTWPKRTRGIATRLDLSKIGRLTFLEPDHQKFPALDLAYSAAKLGGSAPAVLNAANERAVECFIEKRITFGDIVNLTAEVLSQHKHTARPELDELFEIDRWARKEVMRCLNPQCR
jgi:1-deoxy-D-xylulose-5-phosphate reductoisomerase